MCKLALSAGLCLIIVSVDTVITNSRSVKVLSGNCPNQVMKAVANATANSGSCRGISPKPVACATASLVASLSATRKCNCWLVGYFNSEAENREEDGRVTISDIDPDKFTHLIYAFSDINDQNELSPSSAADIQHYQSFNGLKDRNPQLKTLLAVGGLTFNIRKFSTMAASQQNRIQFINSAITLLRENGFDGLNLDWRFPGGPGSQPQDKERFTLLCEELKDTFMSEATETNRSRLIVTATVSAERATIDASYEVAKIAKHLDFINVLTFDFHGPWENVTGHHSPLYRGSKDTGDKIYSNTNSSMQYWQNKGTPAQKLSMGIAAYGRAFTLSSTSSNVGAPASGPGKDDWYTGEKGFWAAYEICLYVEEVTTQLIPDQKVPYATTENQWVGFDNKDSLDTKVSYLKAHNFGGAFVWSLDLDDFSGQFCKQGNYPFISHLHTLLIPGTTTQAATPTTTTNPTTTTTATTTATTRSTEGNKCNGQNSGHFPNPDDPNSYYNCAHGVAHIQYCVPGLVFKDSCKCCDFP